MQNRIFIILLIVFCSCGRKNTSETGTDGSVIRIDLLSEPGPALKKLSEIAGNINYIPLQTSDRSLIGNYVGKIVKKDDRIYLKSGDEIMCFNTEGSFLFKLQKSGRGPEEYTDITDFDVSSGNEFLVILSALNPRLLTYGISDTGFVFQRSVSLGDPAPYRAGIVPGTGNVFLAVPPWRGKEPILSLLVSVAGDTICFKPNGYKYELVRKPNSWALNEMIVYSTGNSVCFKEEFSDTVFYAGQEELTFRPRIIFDSHGTFFTAGMRGGSEPIGNNTTWISNIFETSGNIFLWYSTGPERKRIVFNKKAKVLYLLDTDSEHRSLLRDDLNGGPDFNVEFVNKFYCSDGRLFSFVEAISLKHYVAGDEFRKSEARFPEKKEELIKLAESLSETDNPVLVMLTDKE